jgi:hypothetical protein
MGAILALVMLFALARASGGSRSAPSATPAAHAAVKAQHHAHAAAAKAAQTNKPADHAAAAQAATKAAVLTNKAAAQATHAASQPPPWPQAVPPGLPPWPSGWKPDHPPPKAVVDRSWQLLPVLWQKGKGTRVVENTAGRWISYVATDMGKGVKGVTAWRAKAEPPPPKRDQPIANA